MSTHSPGPWRFDEKECDIYRESDSTTIAVFSAEALPYLPRAADARLMAAAPELLRLLRVLVPMSESGAEDKEGWMVWNAALNEASELIRRQDGDQ